MSKNDENAIQIKDALEVALEESEPVILLTKDACAIAGCETTDVFLLVSMLIGHISDKVGVEPNKIIYIIKESVTKIAEFKNRVTNEFDGDVEACIKKMKEEVENGEVVPNAQNLH